MQRHTWAMPPPSVNTKREYATDALQDPKVVKATCRKAEESQLDRVRDPAVARPDVVADLADVSVVSSTMAHVGTAGVPERSAD